MSTFPEEAQYWTDDADGDPVIAAHGQPADVVPPEHFEEPVRLIGPPHAHLDAPCTDACYQPAEPEPQQADVSPVLDLVRQYGEAHGRMMLLANRDLPAESGVLAGRAAELFARIEVAAQRLTENDATGDLQAQRDEALAERDSIKAEFDELASFVTVSLVDPLVLSLPEVPEGTEALTGLRTGVRYPRMLNGWGPGGWPRSLSTILAHEHPDGVRVELAPPREPRTWPKLDAEPELPRWVEVAGQGVYEREAGTRLYIHERDGGSTWSLHELRELGDVTEVTE